MITVLGATGGQGGAVVRALRGQGHDVRAVVRDPGSARARALAGQGVEVVRGELADAAGLVPAFTGVRAVFAVTTPFERGPEAEVEQGRAVIAAAAAAGVPHLVFTSVASADRATGIPHFESKARIEEELAAAGLPATVVAPAYFHDNTLGGRGQIARGELVLAIPPDKPLQQADRDDLAQVVAAVVAEPGRFAGRRVEIASDAVTPRRMAEVLSRVTGTEVRHISPLPEDIARYDPDMGAMFAFLAGPGYDVDIPALRAEFPGVRWTSFEEWAARQDWGAGRGPAPA